MQEWLDLQDRFKKSNYFRMSNLLQEIHSIRQGDCTLTQYFTDLKILWDELENLKPTPSCTCAVVCTCAMSTAVKQFKDVEYVICFLKGLNECYSNVRSTILTMDPLPTINKAYAMVSQQETLPPTPSPDSTAFVVAPGSSQGRGQSAQSRGRGRNGPKQQMLCTQSYRGQLLLQVWFSTGLSHKGASQCHEHQYRFCSFNTEVSKLLLG